jgi:ankyrin repeat protein
MALMDAIKAGDLAGVSELLERDPGVARECTPEGVSCISIAMYHGKREIARLLADHRTDLDLYEACAAGSLERVRLLIGADPGLVNSFSPDGFAPVALAAFFGHPEIVEALIEAGADVNAQARNAMKVAAIHAAVAARDLRSVEILLRNGADPNLEQQQGFTPMQAAVANGDEAIVQSLAAHGGR